MVGMLPDLRLPCQLLSIIAIWPVLDIKWVEVKLKLLTSLLILSLFNWPFLVVITCQENIKHCWIKTVYQSVVVSNIQSTVKVLRNNTRWTATILTWLKTYPGDLKIIWHESNGHNKYWHNKQEVLWRRFELIPESCTHWQKALHLWIELQATTAQTLRKPYKQLIILTILAWGSNKDDRTKYHNSSWLLVLNITNGHYGLLIQNNC